MKDGLNRIECKMPTQPISGLGSLSVTRTPTPLECLELRYAVANHPSQLLTTTPFKKKYVNIEWIIDILRWAHRLDRLRNDWSRLQDGQNLRDCRKCHRLLSRNERC